MENPPENPLIFMENPPENLRNYVVNFSKKCYAVCLNPVVMSSMDPEVLQKTFDSIVDTMHENKRIISKDADTAKE